MFVQASISEFSHGEELAARVQKDLCQKIKKGKGGMFCEDGFLVCKLGQFVKAHFGKLIGLW